MRRHICRKGRQYLLTTDPKTLVGNTGKRHAMLIHHLAWILLHFILKLGRNLLAVRKRNIVMDLEVVKVVDFHIIKALIVQFLRMLSTLRIGLLSLQKKLKSCVLRTFVYKKMPVGEKMKIKEV